MGLAIFGSTLASVIGAAAGVSTYYVCKWLGRRDIGERYGTATGVVWGIMWFGPMLTFGFWLTTDMQLGLHGPAADAALVWLDVPPGTASDVCYRRTYQRFLADFRMSEADFLAWAKSQGWQPRRYHFKEPWSDSVTWDLNGENYSEDGMVMPLREFDANEDTFVLNGYSILEKPCARAECLQKVIYDVEGQRVYVQW